MKKRSRLSKYVMRSYGSRSRLKSEIAVENIERACEEHLQAAQLTRDQQMVAVPWLINRLSVPLQRLVDMSDLDNVLLGFDLKERAH
jgi:hypothetical protein